MCPTPQLAPVLQLLVFDEASPRALAFQWRKIGRTLADLARLDRRHARTTARGAGGAA